MGSLANGLTQLHGLVVYLVIAALVFGETAVFVGFVLPGEIAAVLGGVIASRGHVSLPLLIVVVVVSAIAGPFIGYEIGRRMGDRLFAARALSRVRGGADKARSVLYRRGGAAVFLGRFVAIVRAIMPAAAGAAQVRYRTFAFYNVLGGLIWGTGYCLLGYLAGSAYAVVERRVGTGLAIAIGAIVVAVVATWAIQQHRSQAHGTQAHGTQPAGAWSGEASSGGSAGSASGGPAAGQAAAGQAAAGQAASGQAASGQAASGQAASGQAASGQAAAGQAAAGEPASGGSASGHPASGKQWPG